MTQVVLGSNPWRSASTYAEICSSSVSLLYENSDSGSCELKLIWL